MAAILSPPQCVKLPIASHMTESHDWTRFIATDPGPVIKSSHFMF